MGKNLTNREINILYKRGDYFLKRNELKKARSCFEKILKRSPNDKIAHHDLSLIDTAENKFDLAEARLKKVLSTTPDFILAKVTLANVYWHSNSRNLALSFLEDSLKEHDLPEHRVFLIKALAEKYIEWGKANKALEFLEEAFVFSETDIQILNQIGLCYFSLDELDKAISILNRSLSLNPNQPGVQDKLFHIHFRKKEFPSAMEHLEQYHALVPDDNFYYQFSLGKLYSETLQFIEAISHFQLAILENSNDPGSMVEIIRANSAILRFRDIQEQIKELVSFIKEHPRNAHDGLLFILANSEKISCNDLYEAHLQFGKLHPPKKKGTTPAIRTGNQPLRVGFVSPDFYQHPVSQFFLPLLKALRNFGLDTYGYSNTKSPDHITDDFKETFSFWKSVVGIPDEPLADIIRSDDIDILVDLAGHTTDNRLGVFSFHPARVTCTYLGYLTTTGLDTMDYWILDETVFPEFMEERLTEKPYRLMRPWISYPLPKIKPNILPIQKSFIDPVIFGTANNVIKFSESSIKLFAKVLHAIPNSMFLLKHRNFINKDSVEGATSAFSACGIPSNRLVFRGFDTSFEDHIKTLQVIDIALDTTPFNGGTTTCDTLYAGVPVLTMPGKRFISRMSAAILHSLGLDEWICASEEEFVAKACAFGMDIEGRNAFRATIQQRMAESKLCDVDDLARSMIEAFKDMLEKAEK